MTRIVNNCVALVCLCLFWGQSLRAADASHSEQIKWGNESVFNENTTLWDSFPEYLADKLYWQAALPTIIADGKKCGMPF